MEVAQTNGFSDWLRKLRDVAARARIIARIKRIQLDGFYGDHKVIDGVIELRFDLGPGYRVYAAERKEELTSVLLLILVGGDKSSQEKDLKAATSLAKAWKSEKDREAENDRDKAI